MYKLGCGKNQPGSITRLKLVTGSWPEQDWQLVELPTSKQDQRVNNLWDLKKTSGIFLLGT